MNVLPNELRLAVMILVNVVVLLAAYRLVSRLTARRGWAAAMDVMLVFYLVQYIAFCVPGVMGVLTVEVVLGVALVLSVAMLWFSARESACPQAGPGPGPRTGRLNDAVIGAGALFLVGYFICMININYASSLVGDDALMYHLPMPAIWIKAHHITLFSTWFSNPANSYSPLAVETFIGWLQAPLGNDVIAHFVQMPGMLLIYFACVETMLGRGRLDDHAARPAVAVLIATAALLSRPFISQSILVKDDLFVAAFFMVMIAGCRRDRLQETFGPWRLGIAAGLFLATKYTALQTAPLLLLVIDAPFRAGWKWRQWLIALACTVIIAGPWYLRNIILTGNPLYPVPLNIAGAQIFKGLFFPSPSADMRTAKGIWNTMTTVYQGLSAPLLGLLVGGWLAALIVYAKLLKDSIIRMSVLGALVGMLLFFFVSHAPEIRYAYPSLLLLFVACGLAIDKLSTIPAIILATLMMILFAFQGFDFPFLVGGFLALGAAVAVTGEILRRLAARSRRARAVLWTASTAVAACMIYVYWNSVILAARVTMMGALTVKYPGFAAAWSAALEDLPPDAPIAYTNIALVRPLMGFDYTHDIVYVPTRPGVRWVHDLPAGNEHVIEPKFRAFVADLLMSDPDRQMWLDHLLASGAKSLVIGKPPYMTRPPELIFAQQDPAHFELVLENNDAAVYRVKP